MRHNQRGFTLIELLLVVAIISLILTLTVPALVTVRRQALILRCQNNMRHIHAMVLAWIPEHDRLVPYLFPESMLDPEHRDTLGTQASVLADIVENNRAILKCPADIGYGGVDYGLTAEGVTCFTHLGQSYAYNNTFYTDPPPGYEGRPIPMAQLDDRDNQIIMLSDFSSVWHGSPGSDTRSSKYFLNLMFFDGHVVGKEFDSDREAKTFRSEHSRWW